MRKKKTNEKFRKDEDKFDRKKFVDNKKFKTAEELYKPKWKKPENSWQCRSCFGWNADGKEVCYICGAGISDPGVKMQGANRIHVPGTDEYKAVHGDDGGEAELNYLMKNFEVKR